ncbi:MAG TPA: hypothetical protein VM074_09540 [Solimonas sp.]|nr:hypothetical protein [Solimonas sp.]
MHPAIRILLLLLVAAKLPALALPDLAAAAAGLGLAFAGFARPAWRALARSIWRLRWLLLAVFALCAAFTPGEPVWSSLPGFSREGSSEGARRVLVLVVLVMAVQLLLVLTPLPKLTQGVQWLAGGLRVLGVDPARFAVRLAGALDSVGRAEALLQAARGHAAASLADAAAQAINALEDAARAQPGPGPLRASAAPGWHEWLWPLALALVLVLYGLPA